jgi:heme exporter protein D
MSEILDLLKMGGYSTYVWPAYGLVVTVLISNLLNIKWQRKRTYKKLEQYFKRL